MTSFVFSFLFALFSIFSYSECLFAKDKDPFLEQTLLFAKNHQTFKENFFKQNEQLFLDLIEKGQSPKTLFICCSDSRVVPSLILQSKPGDLFVIRNAGNFVPPFQERELGLGVSATVEYAVNVLQVKHIVVCGHSHCGAIQALFKDLNKNELGLVSQWIRFGEKAKLLALKTKLAGESLEDLSSVAAYVSPLFQLEHLMTYPFIRKSVEKGDLHLHAWHYQIKTSLIEFYNPQTGKFEPLGQNNAS